MRFLGLAVLSTVAILAAGCGGGSKSSVASLGSAGTNAAAATTPSSASSGPSTSSSSGGGNHLTMQLQNGTKFAACMRAHGVPNFPDPSAQGAIQIGSGSGIDPNSPTFQAAQTTCQKLLPNGGQPTPQQQAQMQRQALAFSVCMRAHGVKDFPDPKFSSGGRIGITMKAGAGSDLNPSSPVFQRAQKACGGKFGFNAGGGK